MKAAMEEEKRQMMAEFEEQRRQMAAEAEAMAKRHERATRMRAAVARGHEDKLKDRKELEERQQAEIERQALEKEGGSRREEFSQLSIIRAEVLRRIKAQMDQFLLTDRIIQAFNDKFAVHVPPPGSPPPTPEMLLRVRLQNEELKAIEERLQIRCESDGLFVALRSLCTANVWKPKDIARQILTGPGALKDAAGAGPDVITKEQFTHFLGRKGIPYTNGSLAFLFTAAGAAKKSAMKTDAFTKAFDTVKAQPVDVGDLSSVPARPKPKSGPDQGGLGGKFVGSAATECGKFVGSAATEGGKFVGSVATEGGKFVESAAVGTSKLVQSAAEGASKFVGRAATTAKATASSWSENIEAEPNGK